ncbi:hypothetical protein DN752_14590 [Echinicola strongylocentroti]|uniref:Collagen-like protein n=1 Tax=Echinicola strongylocentroti TaxID=1795355 RepID=A0A2Z4IR45_9BACT|nr:hypothetical protein [Echinicola strongylocentroti]AWW33199.1 hypothetical protein DN752_14590 [Echinicola strongylocentroti]
MRKLLLLLFVATTFMIQGCEGPPGPQGPPGEPGGLFVGETFEVEVSFNDANNYSKLFDLDPPMEEGDAILIYMNEASPVYDDRNAWRLLPQTFYIEQGTLVYNFDHTPSTFSIFMDNSPVDFAQLTTYWTDNLLFRVVIVPSDLFSANARMDFSNYDATMEYLDIEESDFVKIQK